MPPPPPLGTSQRRSAVVAAPAWLLQALAHRADFRAPQYPAGRPAPNRLHIDISIAHHAITMQLAGVGGPNFRTHVGVRNSDVSAQILRGAYTEHGLGGQNCAVPGPRARARAGPSTPHSSVGGPPSSLAGMYVRPPTRELHCDAIVVRVPILHVRVHHQSV